MDSYFYHYFKPVSAIHIVMIFALMFSSSIRSCKPAKREMYIPIQFITEKLPEKEVKQAVQESVQQQPQVRPSTTTPKPQPSVTLPSKPVQQSRKLSSERPRALPEGPKSTKETPLQSPQRPKMSRSLTAQEIEKILRSSFTSNIPTLPPDDEAKCLELIRKTLYDAWVQPGAEEAQGLEAIVALNFSSGGYITGWRFVKKSGNPLFDETVTKAMNSVNIIPGLSPSFIASKREVTVLFRIGESE